MFSLFNKKDIVINDKINYFDAVFGKGKTRRDNMAYSIIRSIIIGSIVIFCLAIVGNVILVHTMDIEFFMAEPIKIYLTALCSFLMMVVGYLFRGSSEK